MTEKTFKIVNGDMSDGYHTFSELYDHRSLLFIAWICSDGCPGNACWLPEHYPGWDLLSVDIPALGQISYHIPVKFRPLYEHYCYQKKESDHVYDGHTSKDVLERIATWVNDNTTPLDKVLL